MIDHPVLQAIEQHIIKALPEYSIMAGLFSIAIITTQPKPEIIDKWLGSGQWSDTWHWSRKSWQKLIDLISICYRWLYDAVQAFLLSRHPNPTPTPPAEPAKGNPQ